MKFLLSIFGYQRYFLIQNDFLHHSGLFFYTILLSPLIHPQSSFQLSIPRFFCLISRGCMSKNLTRSVTNIGDERPGLIHFIYDNFSYRLISMSRPVPIFLTCPFTSLSAYIVASNAQHRPSTNNQSQRADPSP